MAEGTGLSPELVLPGYESGWAPGEIYAAVTDIDARNVGLPSRIVIDNEVFEAGEAVTRMDVDFEGAGAYALAVAFSRFPHTSNGVVCAGSLGFTVQTPLSVTRVDELFDGRYEERAMIELHLSYQWYTRQAVEFLDLNEIWIKIENLEPVTVSF